MECFLWQANVRRGHSCRLRPRPYLIYGSSGAVEVRQQPAQADPFDDGAVFIVGFALIDVPTLKTLVRAFLIMPSDVLAQHMPQVLLPEDRDVIEAVAPDRSHEAFGKGIEVG